MFKNVASQKAAVFAWDNANSTAKTGDAANITAQISKDAAATTATDDINPTELDAADAPGIYIFDMTQAETDADLVVISPVSSTDNIVLRPVIIYTQTVMRGTDLVPTNPLLTNDARLNNLDEAISSRSSHTAASVWAVGTRTLTSFGTLIADIWTYITRTLTNPNDYKADVSGLALESSVQLIKTETDKIPVMVIDLTFLKDIEGGDWERDGTQMIFRKPGGAEVARFDLFKFDGAPATEIDLEVAKRERV